MPPDRGGYIFFNPIAILIFINFRQSDKGGRVLYRRILRSAFLAAMVGVIAASIIAVFAEAVISLVYGSEYREAASLLVILAWVLAFVLPNAILTQALLALNLERPYAWATSISAICNVTLNVMFISSYGPQAAAWVSIVTEMALLGMLVFVLARYRPIESADKYVSHRC